jgi:predicted  nucleic acid-binding Zn-ribbon protein
MALGFNEYLSSFKRLEKEYNEAQRHVQKYENQLKDNGKLDAGDRNMYNSWKKELQEIKQKLNKIL